MVIMEGTTSPTSRSPSPASSEISINPMTSTTTTTTTIDRNASAPQVVQTMLTCEWDDCGKRYGDVRGLVEHLENEHIGVHKSSYKCEWATCPRRGLVQTSRFALVSHCRSHTGEKPFVCSVPECDKSFTRSDTLAKHLRQQHNIATPAPTRGGYRKRKRSMSPPLLHPVAPSDTHGHTHGRHASHSPPTHPQETFAPSHYNFANRAYAQSTNLRDSGFNTFRVNPAIHDRPAPSVSSTMKLRSEAVAVVGASTVGVDAPLPPRESVPQSEQREEDAGSISSDDEDGSKPYNAEAMGGRSKAMVKYLIMKAKYRYVMDTKGLLNDELEELKRQEKEEWREKEASVDRVLRGLGPHPEQLIHDLDAASNGNLMQGRYGAPPVPPISMSSQDASDVHMDGPGPGLGSGPGGPPPPPPPPHVRHDHRMEVDAR